MIEGQEGVTWDDWLRIAGLVERHGLEGLFRSDHYTAIVRQQAGALDAWTTLAGIAAVTDRIRLGTLVSPATFRHPSVLARMAVTRRPHLGRARRGRDGRGLVRARAHRARLPLPRRTPAVRALRRAGRGRRQVLDRGGLRPRGPGLRAARADRTPASAPATASAARPRRHRQAAVRRPRRPLRERGEHPRRARGRAARAEGAARRRVRRRGPRPVHARATR